MATIQKLLAPSGTPATLHTVVLRAHRSDDLGWVLARHAALYAKEYGWGSQFKLLVAGIIADFLRGHDPAREGCWIAEHDGTPAGSVMLVDAGNGVAKLRLLLVEPRSRGLGIGRRLVEECIRFARDAGYHKITLWTQSILTGARTIYQRAGSERGDSEAASQLPGRSRGRDLGVGAVNALCPGGGGGSRSDPGGGATSRASDAAAPLTPPGPPSVADHPWTGEGEAYAVAPCAFARRKCSPSRGTISTKLQGR